MVPDAVGAKVLGAPEARTVREVPPVRAMEGKARAGHETSRVPMLPVWGAGDGSAP